MDKKPKIWKLLLVSGLFVYPVVNIMFYFLFPVISDFHPLVRTLIFTLILVPLMGLTIPRLHHRFKDWIAK